jgi:hypothetical protein
VPIVTWDPVPGASYYNVQVQAYSDSLPGCDQTSSGTKWNVNTRNTSWTPLAGGVQKISSISATPASDGFSDKLVAGRYCVSVTPVRQGTIVANPTYLDNGDGTGWAFDFTGLPAGSPCSSCQTGFIGQDDYLEPASGAHLGRLPVLVWNPIQGAQSYHGLVSTDPTFATGIVDYGITRIPAYAPRAMGTGAFPDFSVPLYWKVIPSPNANGSGVVVSYSNGAYDSFYKQTVAPTQLAPTTGSVIDGHPTFSWAPSEAAAKYELQVATGTSLSSTFASSTIQDDVTTYATSYTSENKSYPQDKGTLWWRVRAIDAKGNAGAWSAPWSFTQTYDVPTFTGYANATAGAMIPLWEWDPVANAVSYDIDVICSGTGASCTDGSGFETTATSLVKLTGLGQVQWRVRANFASTFGVVHGAYSAVQTFDRSIPAPTNLATQTGLRSVLFSWDSRPGAKQYKVQVSRSTSFTSTFQSITTDNTSFAPSLDSTDYLNGGTFYWRVAEVDNDSNQGQWSSPQVASQPAKIVISTSPGYIQHGVYTTVVVTVKDFAGHVVAGATVKASGAGAGTFTKTTGSLGRASFKLKPTKKGYITFTATKLNYQKATKTITVY